MNILIIDDERDCCDALEQFVKILPHCKVYKAYSSLDGLDKIKKNKYDIVFSDVDMPGLTGVELMNLIKTGNYGCDVVLISGKDHIIKSINAMEMGIYDFLTKPVSIHRIKELIDEIKNKKKIKREISNFNTVNIEKLSDDEIIYLPDKNSIKTFSDINTKVLSDKVKNLYNKVNKLVKYPEIPILIEGETGVGKEIMAKYIHEKSSQIDNDDFKGERPFIAINCGAVSKDIFESEFFGYEKGAFTGSNPEGKKGYIKESENGTLFLDEVSEMPLELQAKLLRVLEEKEYYKVGGTTKGKVNSKIIFAANKNLEALVSEGLFRKDLLYRISLCKIKIPPLRERKEEIIPLAFYFINKINKKLKFSVDKVEAGFLKKLLNYSWPGNIRELKNIITSLVLFNEDHILHLKDLEFIGQKIVKKNFMLSPDNFELPAKGFDLEEFNLNIVKKTLEKFAGNKTDTAKFLNLSRIQLYKRFKISE